VASAYSTLPGRPAALHYIGGCKKTIVHNAFECWELNPELPARGNLVFQGGRKTDCVPHTTSNFSIQFDCHFQWEVRVK
jgi:hypothetical protein